MKSILRQHFLVLIGIPLGALAGFLYWKYIGCVSGSCAITSDPVNSTIYGSVLGGLFLSLFKKDARKHADEDDI